MQLLKLWRAHNTSIILSLLLAIFLAYTIFLAMNLQAGIIPDEPAHIVFSQQYALTWSIPEDSAETYSLGWYIQGNPFLYYWINGRIINIIEFLRPNFTEWQFLISLRLINALWGLGTAIFCFLLSKEVIKNKWWQLLPVFLLTNTLMFVFLSGGVSYDNLANLLSMAAIYFFVKVLNKKKFVSNSLGWLICIFAATLVKYPILPLALALSAGWLIFVIVNMKEIFPLTYQLKRDVLLGIVAIFVLSGNLAIYGRNFLMFQAIRPPCREILTEAQCQTNPYVKRYNELALERKLTIPQSIALGYPDTLTYVIDSWVPNMLYRIFGILGHRSHFPVYIIVFYRLLFYWVILWTIRYWSKPSFTHLSLFVIFIFYTLVLLFINYNSELEYGFKQIALQGRYIFPVIGIAYVLFTVAIKRLPQKALVIPTIVWTLVLFFLGGPLKFLIFHQNIFSSWFIK